MPAKRRRALLPRIARARGSSLYARVGRRPTSQFNSASSAAFIGGGGDLQVGRRRLARRGVTRAAQRSWRASLPAASRGTRASPMPAPSKCLSRRIVFGYGGNHRIEARAKAGGAAASWYSSSNMSASPPISAPWPSPRMPRVDAEGNGPRNHRRGSVRWWRANAMAQLSCLRRPKAPSCVSGNLQQHLFGAGAVSSATAAGLCRAESAGRCRRGVSVSAGCICSRKRRNSRWQRRPRNENHHRRLLGPAAAAPTGCHRVIHGIGGPTMGNFSLKYRRIIARRKYRAHRAP